AVDARSDSALPCAIALLCARAGAAVRESAAIAAAAVPSNLVIHILLSLRGLNSPEGPRFRAFAAMRRSEPHTRRVGGWHMRAAAIDRRSGLMAAATGAPMNRLILLLALTLAACGGGG